MTGIYYPTWGIQPLHIPVESAFISLTAIVDILEYINASIKMQNGFAFLEREDVESYVFENDDQARKAQYLINGLLVSAVVDILPDEKLVDCESIYERYLEEVTSYVNKKLVLYQLESTHEIVSNRDEKFGDCIISFVKT